MIDLRDPVLEANLLERPSDPKVAHQALGEWRHPRAACTAVVDSMAGVFRAAFPAGDADGERKALLIVSLCVGGVVMRARPTTRACSSSAGPPAPRRWPRLNALVRA